MADEIVPLTPDRWEDFARLFGPSGACYGCWCQHFRQPPAARRVSSGAGNRQLMQRRVADGPPPGLIAYRDGEPVGWMQIGPRDDVPEWNNRGRASAPPDGEAAGDSWAISCFFFVRSARGRGLSHAMVAAGIDFARRGGARRLDACPMDRARRSGSIGLFVGSTSVFEKAGFAILARRKPGRPLMRLVL